MPEEIKRNLKQLKDELGQIPEETGALEAKLQDAGENIETYDAEGIDGLIDDVQDEIRKLEVEHPQLTALLGRLMTSLANWGI